jgi:hypothetical protein
MDRRVEHGELDEALRRCGASWNASQAHGFLCSRLALHGNEAASDWLDQATSGAKPDIAFCGECVRMLDSLFKATWRELAERQSEFTPLLPDDATPASEIADALAHWCEGFLNGLVPGPHPQALQARLAGVPLSDIIKDLLEITRATADGRNDDPAGDNGDEEAYTELVEYIRVAVQLVYEDLPEFRPPGAAEPGRDVIH